MVQSLFAQWKPRQRYLKGTEINVMVDNLMNRNYRPELSGDRAYSEGRNLKVSLTRFF
ncbi:hemoglobin/transferrin/lactoferrin receptor protein [Pseudomonas agarici]|nr:hemoglobin/transferrin/lactoferrin receptor protein [Pseudomonas agarici]